MIASAPLLVTLALAAGQQESDWRAEAQAAQALSLPELVIEDLARWRAHVEPTREELGFEEIPWLASFAEGLRAAEQAARPLLLWAMNGHPLGCT